MNSKTIIIIQISTKYAPNKWYDVCTYSNTKEDAIEELKDCKNFNPNNCFRIIERTTTVTDSVIYSPD